MYEKLLQNEGMYWELLQNGGMYWKLFQNRGMYQKLFQNEGTYWKNDNFFHTKTKVIYELYDSCHLSAHAKIIVSSGKTNTK